MPFFTFFQPFTDVSKLSVFKNFAEFTKKTPIMESLCNKVAGPLPESLLNKGPRHRCCSVIFPKVLKTPFLQNPSGWLLLALQALLKDISKWHDWGNNSDFTANTEHIFVCCDNFGSCHPEKPHKILEIFIRNVCGGVPL